MFIYAYRCTGPREALARGGPTSPQLLEAHVQCACICMCMRPATGPATGHGHMSM